MADNDNRGGKAGQEQPKAGEQAKAQEQAKPTKAAAPNKLVILHDLVGPFNKGQVVDAGKLGDEENITRLHNVGAVRVATDDETAHSQVTIADAGQHHPSHEAKVAELENRNTLAQNRIADLERQLNEYRAKDADKVAARAQAEADEKRKADAK